MNEFNSTAQPQVAESSSAMAPAIRWGWVRGLLSLLAWIVALAIVALFTRFVLHLSNNPESGMESSVSTPMGIVDILLQLGVTVLVVYLFRRFVDRKSMMSIGLNLSSRYVKDMGLGVLWGCGLITAVFLINVLAGGVTIVSIQFPWATLITLFIVMILVGMNEEIYSRGYLLTNFMESTNKYVALLITSLLFSAAHLGNPNWTVVGLINIVLAGMLLGIYYVHKGNLWFPIGLHFAWNFFEGAIYGSQVSGVETPSIFKIENTGSVWLNGGDFGFEASLVATVVVSACIILVHVIYRPREGAIQ